MLKLWFGSYDMGFDLHLLLRLLSPVPLGGNLLVPYFFLCRALRWASVLGLPLLRLMIPPSPGMGHAPLARG